ncbi:hypothetical protein [Butyricimonas paravirosa]
MRKIFVFVFIALGVWTSCSDDKDLGPDIPFVGSYQLPQGKSPADDRIVELFHQYGSYFLYEYTQKDFNWTQVSVGGSSTANYSIETVLGNPVYAGEWLDVLERIWLKFYPQEFLSKNLPYRILMADTIKQVWTYVRPTTYFQVYLTTNTLAIAGLNEDIVSMPGSVEKSFKNVLQQKFLEHLINSGVLVAPDEFYNVSDYSTTATAGEDARTRGFLPSIDSEEKYGIKSEVWVTYIPYGSVELPRTEDFRHYLMNMISHAESETSSWATYLTYPLVKKKHDILKKYFFEKYGIEFQKIGDANAQYSE